MQSHAHQIFQGPRDATPDDQFNYAYQGKRSQQPNNRQVAYLNKRKMSAPNKPQGIRKGEQLPDLILNIGGEDETTYMRRRRSTFAENSSQKSFAQKQISGVDKKLLPQDLESEMKKKQNEKEDVIQQGMNDLLKHLDMQFDQHLFSNKFKDEKLEREYQIKFLQDFRGYALFTLIQNVIMGSTIILWALYRLISTRGEFIHKKGIWTSIFFSFGITCQIIQYLLSKRYINAALSFSYIQTTVFLVLFFEQNMLIFPDYLDISLFPTVMIYVQSLSILGYNMGIQTSVYIGIGLYQMFRHYFLYIQGKEYEDVQVAMRFILAVIVALVLLSMFARKFNQRERLKFMTDKRQRQLIELFQSVLKHHHDGIIITSGEGEVLLQNKKIDDILMEKNLDNPEHLVVDYTNKERLVKLLSKPAKQDVHLEDGNENNGKVYKVFSNIWEYIQFQQKETRLTKPAQIKNECSRRQSVMSFFKRKSHSSHSLNFFIQPQVCESIPSSASQNGLSFKQSSGDTEKQLQVFKQTIHSGSHSLTLTTVRDMSYWHELEKQKSISQMQTLAFASAAHEFRNPLNAISASLELMSPLIEEHHDDQISTQYFQVAKSCSNLMLFLVRDILDFAQLESKSLVLNYEPCNIKALIEECVDLLKYNAQQKGIQLLFRLPIEENEQYELITDTNRLKQIIINLLSNGVKYTQKGHVVVSIEQVSLQLNYERFIQHHKQVLQIIVEDTGVGMTEMQVQSLFRPFTKIMSNRNLNKDGVGLGLAVSMNIATALGGQIKVNSNLGVGSVFTVELPLKERKAPQRHMRNEQYRKEILNGEIKIEENSQESSGQESMFYTSADEAQFPYDQECANKYNKVLGQTLKKLVRIADEENQIEETQRKQQQKQSKLSQPSIYSPTPYDEPFNLIVLEGLLGRLGLHKLAKAMNGREALELLKANMAKKHDDEITKCPI
ncbi:hypothetical protein FGO68_gene13077 [Halteria grandinella]|uniref:histidine kinase n=1 Tax=Halteria grandinella TaxID=5974 RepID=A0A8J8P2F2_HALGN|nr:hypothetical protein FGO68_gene13077 [Halteria grandinella]